VSGDPLKPRPVTLREVLERARRAAEEAERERARRAATPLIPPRHWADGKDDDSEG
jgi:hypothetical protein